MSNNDFIYKMVNETLAAANEELFTLHAKYEALAQVYVISLGGETLELPENWLTISQYAGMSFELSTHNDEDHFLEILNIHFGSQLKRVKIQVDAQHSERLLAA